MNFSPPPSPDLRGKSGEPDSLRYRHSWLLINGETPPAILQRKIKAAGTMKDGKTLRLNSFINHQVDCQLMNFCGQHLAHRFGQNHAGLQATKIIAPRSGALLAGNCALAMQLPLVLADTQRPTPSEGTVVHSVTRPAGGQYEEAMQLHVLSEFLGPGDRVLLMDDVLATGKMVGALIELVRLSGATLVGCGFLIDKAYERGRDVLPKDAMIHSLVSIASVKDSVIHFEGPIAL